MQLSTAFDDDDILGDIDREPVLFTPPEGDREWAPVETWTAREWTHWLTQHKWTPPQIAQYLTVDRYRYGLGLQRHPKEPFTFFYLPVPAAVPLHASKTTNVCYGGAVGGTKSHSSRHDEYMHLMAVHNWNGIIMRRTHVELEQNHTIPAIGECARINDFFQQTVMDLTPSQHRLTVKTTNSLLTFGHCQNAGDEEKYLGPSYDSFRPEEMATFLKQQIIGVQGRLRSSKTLPDGSRIVARMIGTTNPGGAQTQYIKDWFIDKNVSAIENPRYDPKDYEFIPARLYDNPYYMDADGSYETYEKRLFMYSPRRRRQLLDGDWDAISGQFFPEWNKHLHVATLDIPHGCKIERWIDWGYSPNPGVCHWVACFPNGRLYVFAEWVFNGEGRPLMVAAKVAERIARLTKDHVLPETKGHLSKTIGDKSMFAKDGHTGESYEETFRRNGVRMLPSDSDRVQGWGRLRHWFGRHPEGGAWLMYHPDCKYAIRTIPALVHDATNPDDCDSSGEDHAGDCDRYGVMGRPTPTSYRHKPLPSLPGSIAALVRAELVPVGTGIRLYGKI